jgi:hypothetical protein
MNVDPETRHSVRGYTSCLCYCEVCTDWILTQTRFLTSVLLNRSGGDPEDEQEP